MAQTLFRRATLSTLLLLVFHLEVFPQNQSTETFDQKYLNWYNRDPQKDNIPGTAVDRAYLELIGSKKPKKLVIVAVMDSGIDIDHEDLKDNIWVNEDEIPGNNIDDDQNGYVDDIHGWNFIGNKNGDNIAYETMEITRIYAWGSGSDYDKAKQLYQAELAKRLDEKQKIARFEENYLKAKAVIKEKTGVDVTSSKDLDAISPDEGSQVMAAKRFLSSRYEQGFDEKSLAMVKNNNQDYLEKFLNPEFKPRSIVGDDPLNIDDAVYGNPDVEGPRSDHGTSVAGVIAAVRDNNLGINGIASNVKIMCIRSTPRGDERDKDVALAIKYAVDNGADIINMSFGKPISPQKKFVDNAVKLAEAKGVLIVHGAGNDGANIDVQENYPSDRFLNGSEATNWINVGASGFSLNETIAAKFSNFGKKHVDIFAPGENIISTDSSNTYNKTAGTSLAAPVVTGVAALLLSYYPNLKCQDLITILLESSFKVEEKVIVPGFGNADTKKIKFALLSKSGGIVNAYEAMKLAEKLAPQE